MAYPLHLQFDCCNDIQLTAQVINHCMSQSDTCCFLCPDIPCCTLTVRCHILCLQNSNTLVAYSNCLICHVLTNSILIFVLFDTSSAVFKLRDLKVVVKQTVASTLKNIVRWVLHLYHPRRTNPKCTHVYPLCPLYHPKLLFVFCFYYHADTECTHVRLCLKCDGTCTETRFRHSVKWTSSFKSVGASVQSTTGIRGVQVSGSNGGYTMFRGSVKSTDYPLHSPVSPSLPLLCITVCHHISTRHYKLMS
jgi:hypothetical protein